MKLSKLLGILTLIVGLTLLLYMLHTLQVGQGVKRTRIRLIVPPVDPDSKVRDLAKDEESDKVHFHPNQLSIPQKNSDPECVKSNLKDIVSSTKDSSTIPKIVHLSYADGNVPQQYVEIIRHCQEINKDHTFIFWTDTRFKEFVKANYPDHEYLFRNDFQSGLEFSDASRYFVIHHFGGVYIDLDVRCRIPFSEGLKPYQCVIDRERETQTRLYWGNEFSAMNSVMACTRKHRFFKELIDNLRKSAKTEKGILARTGPAFLTVQFIRYDKSDYGKSDPVILAPSTLFSPLMDENHLPMFKGICNGHLRNDWQKKGCEEFKQNGYSHGDVKELTKNSITIHLFMHLGWGSWKHRITTRVDVCKISHVHVYEQ